MQISDEGAYQTSWMGFFLSILLGMIMLIFLWSKAVTWHQKKDVDIMSATIENAFDFNDKFTAKQGLFVAAALTEYDNNTERIEVPEKYGELVIEHFGWGYDDDKISSGTRPAIENHYCSDEELGFIQGPSTKVFPIFESSVNEVKTYKKKFKCINEEEIVIWGDYNSQKAQQIAVNFKMCEPGVGECAEKDEILKWLQNKYIVMLYNQIVFDQEGYFTDSLQEEARIVYIPISSQTRTLTQFKLSQTHLELQDYDQIMLGDWTLDAFTGLFSLMKKDSLPYEKDDRVQISVTVEMDLSLQSYERKLYTLFDLLSDVGGLSGILVTIFGLLIALWNYNYFDNMMVSGLFKIKNKHSKTPQDVKNGKLPECRELFYIKQCCRRNKREVAM